MRSLALTVVLAAAWRTARLRPDPPLLSFSAGAITGVLVSSRVAARSR